MPEKNNKKTGKRKKMFRPGTEEREIFCLVLNIFSKLLDEKKVGIEVDSGGDYEVELFLSPSKLKDYVFEEIKGKISFEDFLTIIKTEFESLAAALVYLDKAKGIENNIPSTILKDVGIDEFIWRLEEIEKTIKIPPSLKQEMIFKKTTKGMILEEIKWEINNKTFDEELGQLDNCKYATLSIIYSQSGIGEKSARLLGGGLGIQLPTVTEPKQITLEMQKKDVKQLVDILKRILDTL